MTRKARGLSLRQVVPPMAQEGQVRLRSLARLLNQGRARGRETKGLAPRVLENSGQGKRSPLPSPGAVLCVRRLLRSPARLLDQDRAWGRGMKGPLPRVRKNSGQLQGEGPPRRVPHLQLKGPRG